MQVSIIITVFNLEKYIERTLKSLETNKNVSFEIIIINDGSIDNSESIILNYQKTSTMNIHYFYQNNSGVSSARNLGIKKAEGEYVAFLDGDDFVEPNYIFDFYTVAKDNNCEIAITLYNHVKANGDSESRDYLKYKKMPESFSGKDFIRIFLLNSTIICMGSILFKRDLLIENSIYFDERMAHCEDHKFFIEAIIVSRNVYFNKTFLFNYFQRSDSVTHQINPITIRDKVNLYSYVNKLFYKHKLMELIPIIHYYSLPLAINNVFELFARHGHNNHFNRYLNHKAVKHYIFIALFHNYICIKTKIKCLTLLTLPILFKFYFKYIDKEYL